MRNSHYVRVVLFSTPVQNGVFFQLKIHWICLRFERKLTSSTPIWPWVTGSWLKPDRCVRRPMAPKAPGPFGPGSIGKARSTGPSGLMGPSALRNRSTTRGLHVSALWASSKGRCRLKAISPKVVSQLKYTVCQWRLDWIAHWLALDSYVKPRVYTGYTRVLAEKKFNSFSACFSEKSGIQFRPEI